MTTKSTTFACPLDVRRALEDRATAAGVSLATAIVDACRIAYMGGEAKQGEARLWEGSQALEGRLTEQAAWIASLETRIKALELLVGEGQRDPDGPMGLVRSMRPKPTDPVPVGEGWLTLAQAAALSGEDGTLKGAWRKRMERGTEPGWERAAHRGPRGALLVRRVDSR